MAPLESFMLQNQWKSLRTANLSEAATRICLAGVSKSTFSQYVTYLKKFKRFCLDKGIEDYLNPPLESGIEFLTMLHQEGLSYNTINAARSTLSNYIHIQGLPEEIDFGKHIVTTKFMRGIFKLNPPKPKNVTTWDVKPVLDILRIKVNDQISLKELTLKCIMLLALSTGQRAQTLAALDLNNLERRGDNRNIVFTFDKVLKTSRPGVHQFVEICEFLEESSICPLTCLENYIERTKELRMSSNLFISFQKPHKAVTTQTISRWLSILLNEAGLSRKKFTSHSTRMASSSKAFHYTDINSVLKTVGWTREATFGKFYNRIQIDCRNEFTKAVLS